jgi:hypothetical protein
MTSRRKDMEVELGIKLDFKELRRRKDLTVADLKRMLKGGRK